MCGCHCYYLWSLSLNRLLARWARNGQSGLDCINYSSSPLYMAVPCHTILYQTYHYITTYYTTLLFHTTKHNAIPNHAISYQQHTISHQLFIFPPLNGQSTIPVPLYPSTPLFLASYLSLPNKSNISSVRACVVHASMSDLCVAPVYTYHLGAFTNPW